MNQNPLSKKYKELCMDAGDVVNIHAHLPVPTPEMKSAYAQADHSLLPEGILNQLLAIIDPATFVERNRGIIGSCAIYAVGEHNLLGKACPIYSPNDHVLQLSRNYPDFFIPFCSTDMSAQSAEKKIEELKQRGAVGMKYHALEGYPLKNCSKALAKMEELNMPLVIHLGDTPFLGVNLSNADPKTLIPVANQFPNLRMLITHFATPLHMEAFWVATRYENIYMDTAEYPVYWTPSKDNSYGPLLSPLHTKRVGIHKFV